MSPGFGVASLISTILRVANNDKLSAPASSSSPPEAAVGRMQLAAREAGAHCRGAHLLERLVDEQRLVTGDEIDLGQTIGEVTLELTERDFQKVFGLRPFELLERHGLILEQHGMPSRTG